MINPVTSGDTVTLAAPLINAETGAAIDAATVSEVWVAVGDTEYSTADSVVGTDTIDGGGHVTVTLTGPATQALSGFVPIWIKVRLASGQATTIVKGEPVRFAAASPISDEH